MTIHPDSPDALPALASCHSGPASYHTRQHACVKKIRPLPPIPTSSPPATPQVSQGSPRSLRPLPPAPSPPPPPSIVISVTPATPVPPPTPASTPPPVQQLSPPSHPQRPVILSLQTSPDALAPSTNDQSMLSPLTPEIPRAPSPNSARRKRMSKLRRHLGERVPDELVFGHDLAAAAFTKVKIIDSLRDVGEGRLYSKAATAARKVLEIEVHGDESESEEDEDDDDEKGDYTWVLAHGATFRAVPVKRYSKKWIREKGGRRWEENNYSNVLRTLREL